jgi:hypothetical protein
MRQPPDQPTRWRLGATPCRHFAVLHVAGDRERRALLDRLIQLRGCHQWRHREQAEHLVARERKKPKQANLRRAAAAYYALFHLLVGDGPTQPPGLSGRIQRAFDHSDMRTVCKGSSKPAWRFAARRRASAAAFIIPSEPIAMMLSIRNSRQDPSSLVDAECKRLAA